MDIQTPTVVSKTREVQTKCRSRERSEGDTFSIDQLDKLVFEPCIEETNNQIVFVEPSSDIVEPYALDAPEAVSDNVTYYGITINPYLHRKIQYTTELWSVSRDKLVKKRVRKQYKDFTESEQRDICLNSLRGLSYINKFVYEKTSAGNIHLHALIVCQDYKIDDMYKHQNKCQKDLGFRNVNAFHIAPLLTLYDVDRWETYMQKAQ